MHELLPSSCLVETMTLHNQYRPPLSCPRLPCSLCFVLFSFFWGYAAGRQPSEIQQVILRPPWGSMYTTQQIYTMVLVAQLLIPFPHSPPTSCRLLERDCLCRIYSWRVKKKKVKKKKKMRKKWCLVITIHEIHVIRTRKSSLTLLFCKSSPRPNLWSGFHKHCFYSHWDWKPLFCISPSLIHAATLGFSSTPRCTFRHH